MIKYNNTNNASTTLTAWISASSTTLIVENGDILPTAPFLLTLEHFDNEKVTVREIVKCIAKAWNVLTIQRGAWTCVQDDTASTKEQGNSAHSFSVGDCASIYWTSEQVQDIQNEIEKKLNIDDFQAWTYVYGATSTETDAYSITIPWTLTSYSVGQVFRFMADVDNEWNATLNINGLWAVEIRKNHDKILDNGDIEAWQIVEVAYDWTYFQMDSQVATVVDVASLWNTQYKTWVAGEDLEVWDVCYMVDYEKDCLPLVEVWRFSSSWDFEVIWTWIQSDTIKLRIGREWSTSGENLVVELIDWEDILGSIQVNRAELTADIEEKTLSFWEQITTEKWRIYTLRLRTYNNGVSENYYIVNKRKQINFLKDVSISWRRPDTISSDSVTAGTWEYRNSILTYHIWNSADVVWGSNGNFKVEVWSYYLQRSGSTLTNNFSDSASVSWNKQFRIKIYMNSICFYYKSSTDTAWTQFWTTHIVVDRASTIDDFTFKIEWWFTISNLFINAMWQNKKSLWNVLDSDDWTFAWNCTFTSPATLNLTNSSSTAEYNFKEKNLYFETYLTNSGYSQTTTITYWGNTISLFIKQNASTLTINWWSAITVQCTYLNAISFAQVFLSRDTMTIWWTWYDIPHIDWNATILFSCSNSVQINNLSFVSTEWYNFVTSLLHNKNVLKITNWNYDRPILISSTYVEKWENATLETWWTSWIFTNWTGVLYIQSDWSISWTATDYAIGEYNKYGEFNYYDWMVKKWYYSESLTFSRSESSKGSDWWEIILKWDCYLTITVTSSSTNEYMDILTYFNWTLIFHAWNAIFLWKKWDKIGCYWHKQTTWSYVSYSCNITAVYNL